MYRTIIEVSYHQIIQFQLPAGYSGIETYERQGVLQARNINVKLKLKNCGVINYVLFPNKKNLNANVNNSARQC
jgi:hypothetical protein